MISMQRDQARLLARALGTGRVAIGVFGLVAPGPLCRMWAGPEADTAPSRMFGRIVGGREVALGLGTLLALSHDAPVRGWLEAASLADAVDCVVTTTRFPSLPRAGRWLFALGAAGAATAEALAARSVD